MLVKAVKNIIICIQFYTSRPKFSAIYQYWFKCVIKDMKGDEKFGTVEPKILLNLNIPFNVFVYRSAEETEKEPDIQNVTPKYLYSLAKANVSPLTFKSCLYNPPVL